MVLWEKKFKRGSNRFHGILGSRSRLFAARKYYVLYLLRIGFQFTTLFTEWSQEIVKGLSKDLFTLDAAHLRVPAGMVDLIAP